MTDEEITYLWGMSANWKEFARAIEAKVREECAVICEVKGFELRDDGMFDYGLVAIDCAEAIRGRGTE